MRRRKWRPFDRWKRAGPVRSEEPNPGWSMPERPGRRTEPLPTGGAGARGVPVGMKSSSFAWVLVNVDSVYRFGKRPRGRPLETALLSKQANFYKEGSRLVKNIFL